MKIHKRDAGRFIAAVVLAYAFLSARAGAADKEFQTIVSRLSTQYQKNPMRFMGLLNFIANRFTPSGVSKLKMAVFEDLDPARGPAGVGLDSFMQTTMAGGGFQPFVRVRSNRDSEQTFIYAKVAGIKYDMLIVSLEEDEAVVIKMRLSPEKMNKWLGEPVHMGKDSAHGAGSKFSR